jgi:hypothetical protein
VTRIRTAVAWLKAEPIVTLNGIIHSVIAAGLIVLATFGLNLTDAQQATVYSIVAALLGLLLAMLGRQTVTPTAKKAVAQRKATGSHPTRKVGRKPPKNEPALKLGPLLTGVLPAHPGTVDYGKAFTGWKMLGNDQYGDCVAVATANMRACVTANLTGTVSYPTLADVEAFYKTQNPGFPKQDDGMDEQTACEALISTGIAGTKALAFAKVDLTNPDEVSAALAIFGCLLFGITVLNGNQTEFSAGQPWDYVPKTGVDGGHGVLGLGYLDETGQVRFVTWAEETSWTDAFYAHEVEEAWAVIWPEHLGSRAFLEGVDVAQLAADFLALTGKTLPIPVPAPVPAPTPAPGGSYVEITDPTAVARINKLAAAHGETPQAYLTARALKF